MNTLPSPMQAPVIALEALRQCSRFEGVTDTEQAALERLIAIARADSGQSRKVADFLLAWWNSGTCGSFDLTILWGVDGSIAADMVTVFALVARCNRYPDSLGYGEAFAAIVRAWRPEVATN